MPGAARVCELPGRALTRGLVVVRNGNGPWGALNSGGGANFISIQGSGASLKQTLTGLTVGATYTVNFLATHRPGYGNDETLHVNVDGAVIWETRTPEDSFTGEMATFTATAESVVLAFQNDSPNGDKSVFVDEISVSMAASIGFNNGDFSADTIPDAPETRASPTCTLRALAPISFPHRRRPRRRPRRSALLFRVGLRCWAEMVHWLPILSCPM